ncbi:hypothetical protein AK812_SmicGene17999 [Symbiodinium microadriaticum]|uniref:Uncharacterized protein n=1 Tax=Symbiodinium microadriaticum TaxID=2951 RepID=A0A1Q9DWD6_SYMMI|nr:hypothetical protein AK812_SmicGene17999 [Symbiodinium microadriaticum]
MSGTSMSSRMGEQHQPQQTSVFAKMQGMGTGMGGMGNMGAMGSMGMARKGKGGMGMNNMNNMGGMNSGMGGMGGMGGGMAGGMCGQGMQGMGGMGMAQGNEKGKMGAGGMCGMTMGAMGQKGMGKPMGCKGDSNGCGAQGRPPIGGSMGQRPPVMMLRACCNTAFNGSWNGSWRSRMLSPEGGPEANENPALGGAGGPKFPPALQSWLQRLFAQQGIPAILGAALEQDGAIRNAATLPSVEEIKLLCGNEWQAGGNCLPVASVGKDDHEDMDDAMTFLMECQVPQRAAHRFLVLEGFRLLELDCAQIYNPLTSTYVVVCIVLFANLADRA